MKDQGEGIEEIGRRDHTTTIIMGTDPITLSIEGEEGEEGEEEEDGVTTTTITIETIIISITGIIKVKIQLKMEISEGIGKITAIIQEIITMGDRIQTISEITMAISSTNNKTTLLTWFRV